MTVPVCSNTTLPTHEFEKYIFPFECSLCGLSYFHNNYIFSNKKCKTCHLYVCVKCQIKELDSTELKELIFKNKNDKEVKNACIKLNDNKIPQFGVCVKI